MDELKPGDRLDHFEIEKVLHAGAMARLYKAKDLLYGDHVALKVPLTDILNNPIPLYHYQNEERIGRYLNHPSIIRFISRDRSCIYLIMEYISGNDLRALLRKKKKLSSAQACGLTLQVAHGLHYLHSISIHHLDLKPENIMITPADEIKIFDFGLACHLGHLDLLSLDFQAPHGTPYYISPEQLCGRRDDPRSDLYSLGIIFYEMLTGKLPFKRSKKLSNVQLRLKTDPVPPRYYDRNIKPEIQEVILKLLARDPEDRYSTAAELQHDLHNIKKVVVTEQGRKTSKPSVWPALFKTVGQSCKLYRDRNIKDAYHQSDRQILGCIFNNDISDLVVDQVRREVLMHGGKITLLTVIDEENDHDLLKYAKEVEGGQFSKRLDRYILQLKRYNLDPTVRIKSGDIAEVVLKTAENIQADLIVLGPPCAKKGLSRIFSGSTINKIMKVAICNVMVAEPVSPGQAPTLETLFSSEPERLKEVDLFLIDAWVHHVNWLSELTHILLINPTVHPDLDEQSCAFGAWLAQLSTNDHLKNVSDLVNVPHKKFHRAAEKMAQSARSGDIEALRDTYLNKALPLSAEIKTGLQKISSYLQLQSKHHKG